MKKNVLTAVIILLLLSVASAWCEPVKMQIPYKKTTTLAYPKTLTFKFSLWDALTEGTEVWSEEKTINLTGPTIQTNLGTTVNLNPSDFAQQLWVQVDRKKPDGTYVTVGTRDMLKAVPYSIWAPVVPTVLMKQESPGSLNVPDFWPSSTPICKLDPYTPSANKTALIDAMIQFIDDAGNTLRLVAAYSTDGGTKWSTPNTHVIYTTNVAGAWSCPASSVDSLDLTAGVAYTFAVMYDESGGTTFTTQSSLCRLRVTIVDR